MRLVFDGNRRCRAFAVPGEKVSVVADRIDDQARGTTLDQVLTLVTDAQHHVCDVELVCDPARASGDIALHEPGHEVAGKQEVTLDPSSSVRWHLDETSGYLRVQVGDNQPTKWLRIGSNDLWLGVRDDNELATLVYVATRQDPSGAYESRWLDEIGA